MNPLTGWYRDGYCRTDHRDYGVHTVCASMTSDFLQFTKSQGNDLSTPRPPSFPGLNPGDRWCLCASRWEEARRAGKAPDVVLEATNGASLRSTGVTLNKLTQHSHDPAVARAARVEHEDPNSGTCSNDVCKK